MHAVRRSDERGQSRFDWLDSRHSFSFGGYHDSRFMGFGPLRVINEDIVAPAKGFPTHPHRDMEILTWIMSGRLEHRDSTGGGGIIGPGEIQYMSAGTGIAHSEFNASTEEPCHLLQIWIMPDKTGVAPAYGQKDFNDGRMDGAFGLVASPDGAEDSIRMHQDASIRVARLEEGAEHVTPIKEDRLIWLQVARGSADVLGETLEQGDGLAAREIASLPVRALRNCELMLFDMAP